MDKDKILAAILFWLYTDIEDVVEQWWMELEDEDSELADILRRANDARLVELLNGNGNERDIK